MIQLLKRDRNGELALVKTILAILVLVKGVLIVMPTVNHLVVVKVGGGSVLERLVLVLQVVGRGIAAAPGHLDAFLQVRFGNPEVLVRYRHLGECVLRLPRTHSHLLQEMVERCYQIFTEIEVIMVHACWQYETARTSTVIMQLLRVFI